MQDFRIEPQIQVTLSCNMACNYCFQRHGGGVVDLAIVDRIVSQVVDFHQRNYRYHDIDQPLIITWHGGEPLLAGIDFFRGIVEIENQHSDIRFDNRVQTNGTLMTNEFAEFFARHEFSVGFSLDGPESMNNAHSHYRAGSGNPFTDALAGLNRYRQVTRTGMIPVIAVVTSETIKRPDTFYHFFKLLNAKVQLDIYDLRACDLLESFGNNAELSVYAPDHFRYWRLSDSTV